MSSAVPGIDRARSPVAVRHNLRFSRQETYRPWIHLVAGLLIALVMGEASIRAIGTPRGGVRTAYGAEIRSFGEGMAASHFLDTGERLTGNPVLPGSDSIVLLGNSFVEALQVPDGSTMGAVLERIARGACFVCFAWIFFRAQSFADSLVILEKVVGIAPEGIRWFYSPLFLVLPAIVAAHYIGLKIGLLAGSGASLRHVKPPAWLEATFRGNGERLAVKPHPAAGLYCLLPIPGLSGGVVLGLWAIVLYLFAALNTSPFI